eukprot:gnl/Spiro4/111_TR60_c0_g1_i1.p1 gnl/Spiro4/111_TR60_c0_g1~~gnl/Spiro4/111_TR60_c0_g1_i1.p1  ORF type:complete len:868 (+),score=224.66 gnl/Spiro4/111_TR60_c0_g1_i1:63-2666(+)
MSFAQGSTGPPLNGAARVLGSARGLDRMSMAGAPAPSVSGRMPALSPVTAQQRISQAASIQNEQAMSSIAALQLMNKELSKENAEFQKQMYHYKALAEQSRDELTQHRDEMRESRNKLELVKSVADKSKSEIQTMEMRLQTIAQQLGKSREQRADAEDRWKRAEESLVIMQQQAKKYQLRIVELENDIQHRDVYLENLRREISLRDSSLREAKTKAVEREELESKMQHNAEYYRKLFEGFRAVKENLEHIVHRQENELATFRTQQRDLNAKLSTEKHMRKKAINKKQQLKREMELELARQKDIEKEKMLSQLSEHKQKLKEDFERQQQALQLANIQALKEGKLSATTPENEEQAVQLENIQLRQKVTELNQQLKDIQDEKRKLYLEFEQLKLKNTNQFNQTVSRTKDAIERSLNSAADRITQLTQPEQQRAKAVAAELRHDMQDLGQSVDTSAAIVYKQLEDMTGRFEQSAFLQRRLEEVTAERDALSQREAVSLERLAGLANEQERVVTSMRAENERLLAQNQILENKNIQLQRELATNKAGIAEAMRQMTIVRNEFAEKEEMYRQEIAQLQSQLHHAMYSLESGGAAGQAYGNHSGAASSIANNPPMFDYANPNYNGQDRAENETPLDLPQVPLPATIATASHPDRRVRNPSVPDPKPKPLGVVPRITNLKISGRCYVGEEVHAEVITSSDQVEFLWFRVSADGLIKLPYATTDAYVPTIEDLGAKLQVEAWPVGPDGRGAVATAQSQIPVGLDPEVADRFRALCHQLNESDVVFKVFVEPNRTDCDFSFNSSGFVLQPSSRSAPLLQALWDQPIEVLVDVCDPCMLSVAASGNSPQFFCACADPPSRDIIALIIRSQCFQRGAA